MTIQATSAGRSTVPWSWPSDPAILARETDRIFRRAWQYAGRLGELPGPGSYVASATGPMPIVLTLDGDGVLRGFVNVCRHRGADALGDLPGVVAEHGLDVAGLRFHRRVHYEIRANWKIALKNYLECYHCPVNHPGLVQVIDERRLGLVADGLRTSQFAPVHPRTLEGNGPIDVSTEVGAAQNHLWFPTLKCNVLPGHPNLSLGPLWPTGPDTCAGYLDYWFGQTADARWIEELFALDNQVGAEDTALVEAAQRGSARGGIEHGWVLGGPENLIGHFQDYVRAQPGETA
jgi:phenylpropionate dioxygenase-like ring-hydroxylating dioxygenase large terminal subunit